MIDFPYKKRIKKMEYYLCYKDFTFQKFFKIILIELLQLKCLKNLHVKLNIYFYVKTLNCDYNIQKRNEYFIFTEEKLN